VQARVARIHPAARRGTRKSSRGFKRDRLIGVKDELRVAILGGRAGRVKKCPFAAGIYLPWRN
jgi:hypothetical protein